MRGRRKGYVAMSSLEQASKLLVMYFYQKIAIANHQMFGQHVHQFSVGKEEQKLGPSLSKSM